MTLENNRILNEKSKILNDLVHSQDQRIIESNRRTRYTIAAISEKIKRDLASVIFDINDYKDKIAEYKQNRPINQHYYDYELELDFSDNPKIPFDIDDRWYYYKAYHYLKLGLFLNKKEAPPFNVKIDHLSQDIIYELRQLDSKDRKFVLKLAVSRIFEDINFDLYHDSISANLEVILVK
jgi:hypothetical protein